MKTPRGLSAEEAAAWLRLAESVTPMAGKAMPKMLQNNVIKTGQKSNSPGVAGKKHVQQARPIGITTKRSVAMVPKRPAPSPKRVFASQLDGHTNRKLKAGQIAPDYTLDLHGHTLDSAYQRITSGLDQARVMNARVVLVIAGRERPVDPADRGAKRGAIRAKLLDWLAASRHAEVITAVRRAHIRHGGDGALYLVLRRI